MNPRFQRRVQRYGWDKAGMLYEQYWQLQVLPAQQRMLELASLGSGERVLDISCGTGLVTFAAAAEVGPEGEIVATDISQRMVDLVLERGIENVSAFRADAEALGEKSEGYDVALNALGLMYVADPGQAAVEMHRVLRPGGRVAVCVWGQRDRCGWAEVFPIMDARVQSQVCPMFFQQGTGGTLAATLERAGLVDIQIERLSTSLVYESEEAAIGAAFAGGPSALAYSKFDDSVREAVHGEYIQSIEPFRQEAGFEVPAEFVIACARRPQGMKLSVQ